MPPKSAFPGSETPDYASPGNGSDSLASVKDDIFGSDSYIRTCDPGSTDVREQLRCFKMTSELGKGGQAWTFRGRRNNEKENKDTVYQAYVYARGQELAESNGKGMEGMDSHFKRARKEALETLSERNGKKKLKSSLEKILKQKKYVCIRATNQIIDRNARQRIDREITAAGISGSNIIPVYNFGTINGRFVFVMPLVKNTREPYGFSLDQLIDGAYHIAEGLGYMHKRGMLHRDVKPENMLFTVSSNGRKLKGKLIDLGLMKILGDEEEKGTLTNSSMIAGTIPYCSPEQAVGLNKADVQSDIYSLGASFYQMLAWENPNPINPANANDDQEAKMEYYRNLTAKFRGDGSDNKPTRPMNIDRRVTLREFFNTCARHPEPGKDAHEISREDADDGNIDLASRLRKWYSILRHPRQYRNQLKRLEDFELVLAAMMHPGERTPVGKDQTIYTKRYRYGSMQQVIEDLESIREGKKPIHAYAMVQKKYSSIKNNARERYISEVFCDHSRYSRRAVRTMQTLPWYAKAACLLGSAAAGGIIGTVAEKHLWLGERLQPVFDSVYEFLSTIQ